MLIFKENLGLLNIHKCASIFTTSTCARRVELVEVFSFPLTSVAAAAFEVSFSFAYAAYLAHYCGSGDRKSRHISFEIH